MSTETHAYMEKNEGSVFLLSFALYIAFIDYGPESFLNTLKYKLENVSIS